MRNAEVLGGVMHPVRLLCVASVALGALPVLAEAQGRSARSSTQAATVFYACYVPDIGAMYMIGVPGTPDDCLSSNHVKISWNEQGPEGPPGPQGLSCWDLDADGVKDADEDKNGDGVWDTLDCQGSQGPPGPQGLSCWDLDADGVKDADEDKNGDGAWDALDCQGSGTDTIPDASVTTAKLAPGAVTSAKIADGEVNSSDIADNAVTGSKIAAEAVEATDIAAAAISTNHITDGSVTAAKLAAGAVALELQLVEGSAVSVSPNATVEVTLDCPGGYRALSGGWENSGGSNQLFVPRSLPSNSSLALWLFQPGSCN